VKVITQEERWRQSLRRWGRRLSMVRFCRAVGGHANDGDELMAVFRYESIPQLQAVPRRPAAGAHRPAARQRALHLAQARSRLVHGRSLITPLQALQPPPRR